MVHLSQLPPELVSNVLSFVDPEDLPSINLTCSYLYHAVRGNTALFRALYLNHLVSVSPLYPIRLAIALAITSS